MKERKEKEKIVRILSLLIFSILITILLPFSERETYTMRKGEIPQRDIVADFTFEIPKSEKELAREKEEILKTLTLVLSPLVSPSVDIDLLEQQLLSFDKKTKEKFLEGIKNFFTEVKDLVIVEELDTIKKLNREFVILLTPEGDKFYPVDKILSLQEIRDILKKRAREIFPSNLQLSFLFEELISPFIYPSYRIDFEETQRRERKLIESIQKIKEIVYKGEVIAKAGEPISDTQIEKLEVMEALRRKTILSKFTLIILRYILFFLIITFAYYSLRFIFHEIYNNTKLLFITLLNIILFLLISSIVIKITRNPFFIPFAFIPFFFYFITGRNFAILVTMILSIFCAIYSGMSLFLLIYFLSVGISGILISKFLRKRVDLIYGFFMLWVISLALTFFFKIYVDYPLSKNEILLSSIFSSGLSILGSITFLPLHEKIFGITTDFVLLELSSPDYFLLKELEKKAPGTFEHSLRISELAGVAAESIGANPLIAKVGALYHDIGKIEMPEYFIENQKNIKENPHTKLSPSLSATIIRTHVKKGIELAKKYRLPESIIRIIERHHGTLVMGYFYEKAKKLNPNVVEEEFRYKSPKPEKKEEALIMLLDGIEAAVRNLEKYNFKSISDAIDSVINHRFSDGQFDRCEITRKDIEKIKEVILPKLVHRYHTRLDYPPLIAKEKIV
ncbi:MAG: HDIG domain-containing metalloprotein [Candidatus Hydrothermales bacterium]